MKETIGFCFLPGRARTRHANSASSTVDSRLGDKLMSLANNYDVSKRVIQQVRRYLRIYYPSI